VGDLRRAVAAPTRTGTSMRWRLVREFDRLAGQPAFDRTRQRCTAVPAA
jgi:hypothetical protein